MPHHAVIRKHAVTIKLRILFDASSHTAGQRCLNDVLCKGMKLEVEVVQLLVTFRCHSVVIVADLKKGVPAVADSTRRSRRVEIPLGGTTAYAR
ncbi:hypothetical protein HPB48_019941 [Haemaphysalis longicornis]|uniref:Uncharacterized protein n=1 Tax=Haemaphysalis longicornis TaxID=44386 RepID=A0A9J6GCC1_HAELO|nr:hypothetical protein HPB48_019941 [Haemaphysalis longicornis]